jgi:hypothetical protein
VVLVEVYFSAVPHQDGLAAPGYPVLGLLAAASDLTWLREAPVFVFPEKNGTASPVEAHCLLFFHCGYLFRYL